MYKTILATRLTILSALYENVHKYVNFCIMKKKKDSVKLLTYIIQDNVSMCVLLILQKQAPFYQRSTKNLVKLNSKRKLLNGFDLERGRLNLPNCKIAL